MSVGCGLKKKLALGLGNKLTVSIIELLHPVTASV